MTERQVAIVTNIPTPYRKGFFAALAAQPGVKPTVFYCAAIERGRKWGDQVGTGYSFRFPWGITVGTSFHVNPGLPLALARGRFDTVVVGGYTYPSAILALLAARLFGSRAVIWLDGPVGSKMAVAKRLVLRLADRYVVASTKAKESLIGLGVDSQRIDVVPLTVDTNAWDRARTQLPARLEGLGETLKSRHVLLFCGRFIPAKNLDFILELAERLRDLNDIMFLLVGDGPLLEAIEKRVQERAIPNVAFTGFTPPEELPPLFAISQLLLLPSVHESWGAVVNEALASGVPVMVSSVAGASDLIEDGKNGFIVDPHDVDRAEALIREYLSDTELRERMRRSAKSSGVQLTHAFAAELFARAVRG